MLSRGVMLFKTSLTGLLLLALAACSGSVEQQQSGSASGSGGATTSSTTVTSTSSSNDTVGSVTSAASGTTLVCGGLAGTPCPAGMYCDYFNDHCGGDDDQGTCVVEPGGCPDNYSPTCGCDGMVYGNECDAHGHGVDTSTLGNCPAPAGFFPCGHGFCELGGYYCEHDISDVGNEPDSFSCKTLPPVCEAPASCACLTNVPCGDACLEGADGSLTVACPGG